MAAALAKPRKVMTNPRFFKFYYRLGGITALFVIGAWFDNYQSHDRLSTFMNKSGCFPPRDLGPGNKRW